MRLNVLKDMVLTMLPELVLLAQAVVTIVKKHLQEVNAKSALKNMHQNIIQDERKLNPVCLAHL